MKENKNRTKPTRQTLGQDIRALRKTRGIKQTEMARNIGRSLGFISQIERGISTPSINDLRALSKCLQVPISWFFNIRPDDHKYIVRKDDRRKLGSRLTGLVEELLSPDLGGSFEILRSVFEPGAQSSDLQNRQTEEAGYVMNGQLELWINDEHHTLNAGDSFRFNNQPHRWRNSGDIPAEVIWVISPPVY